jgi:hypothetical protein
MKLIIAGSRTITGGTHLIDMAIQQFPELQYAVNYGLIVEVVSGTANGIDKLGETWAETYPEFANRTAPRVVHFPANWNAFQRAAGPMRNKEMAAYADALLLIWDGESKGSANMKMQMEKLKKPIYEVVFRGPKKA